MCVGLITQASAQQFITVDFSSGQLWHTYGDGRQDLYQVVLPKHSVQSQMNIHEQPVVGRYEQADFKPTWWPTARMRREDNSLPPAVRFGEPRHPIGIYRMRILWQNPDSHSFWSPVRIHGGAQVQDLNQSKSAGCVRMLDQDIVRLVANLEQAKLDGDLEVIVTFGFL